MTTDPIGLCDGQSTGFDYLNEFQFLEAVTCPYADSAGLLIVGLLILGGVCGSIYIRTGSVIIPMGLIFMSGGSVLGLVAGPGMAIVTLVVLVAGGGIIAYAYYEWSR